MRLAGKTVLVTGGGTGIGAAIAHRFAAEGAAVTVMGRRREPLEQVAESVVVGDVTDPGDRDRAIASTGPLDVLVNNAGGGGDMAGALALSAAAPYELVRLAEDGLVARRGAVVNIASVAAFLAGSSAAYSAGKAAMVMVTRSLARELGPRGVRVNAVCPGWVRTPMGDRSMRTLDDDLDAAYAKATRHVPLGRPALPEEVAAAALFLASDEASYITGTALLVDGGATVVDAGHLPAEG